MTIMTTLLSVGACALFLLAACVEPTTQTTVDVGATVSAQVALTVESERLTVVAGGSVSAGGDAEASGQKLTLEELQDLLSKLTPEPTSIVAQNLTATPETLLSPTPTPTKNQSSRPSPTPTHTPSPTPTASPEPTPTPRILAAPTALPTPDALSRIERAARAVVFIKTTEGTGSGFVFDNEGHILTNAHVVGSSRTVTVRYNDQFNFRGTVVNTDPVNDLAVIKIDTRIPLEVLEIGDSSAVRLGESVHVIGYPFGTLLGSQVSIAEGIMSSRREFMGVEYLQTDAAINPGNSGGPLVNFAGEVIGINTSRLEEVAGRAAQGIGLAISSNYFQRVLPFLLEETALLPSATATLVPTVTATPEVDGDRFVYRNTRFGYSFEVPSDWSLDASDPSSVLVESDVSSLLMEVYPTGITQLEELALDWIDFHQSVSDYDYVYEETKSSGDVEGRKTIFVSGRLLGSTTTCASVFDAKLLLDEGLAYELSWIECDGTSSADLSKMTDIIVSFTFNVELVLPTPIPAPTKQPTPSPTATPLATPSPAPTATRTPKPSYELNVEIDPPDGGQVFVNPWDNQLMYDSGTLVELTAVCFSGDSNWFGHKPEYGETTDESIFMFMDDDKFVLLSCQ
jgi:S1-C subfamily serine protease